MKKITAIALAALLMAACTVAPKTTLCVNPLTYTDIPDPDIIRVGDDYYMVSTTMYFCPGAPIMHSRDLVHWSIVSYVYDCLEDDDVYNLRNGRQAYGKGQWAASLKYHDGEFYALFIANDQARTYIYHTSDITSSNWDRYVIDRPFHDSGLLFEDGRVYVAWGNRNIYLTELEPDFSGVRSEDRLLFSTPQGYMLGDEGAHFYHIGDYYYILTINWPFGGVRTETCWRSDSIYGPYEPMDILKGAFDGRGDGVAQGGIIDTPAGDWYAVMFQDHGAVGRIPTLQPLTWVDGWPILGDNGVPVKEFEVNLPPYGADYVWDSDEFDSDRLALVWQWNHKPLDGKWSLTENPGHLHVAASPATGLFDARNVLTQRTVGPACESSVLLDVSGLLPGDHAGICAFQSHFCAIEVECGEDGCSLVGRDFEGEIFRTPLESDKLMLRISYDFTSDTAKMSYSYDGLDWTTPDYTLQMRYTLDFFTGYRTALYCYHIPTVMAGTAAADTTDFDPAASTTSGNGGYADFDWFHQSWTEL